VGGIYRSDLCASGGADGFVRLWKVAGAHITEIGKIQLEGFVNGICFAGNRLVVAVGQEHRLGRWGRVPKVRNGIAVVPLPLSLQD
jgi:ribosomal RNA-processing protein 9